MTHASASSQRAATALERRTHLHVPVVAGSAVQGSSAEQATAISRLVVQATSAYTGRGPTRVHTVFDEQAVTVLLYDSMSRGERNLIRDGVGHSVLESRQEALRSVERRVRQQVADIAGRPVAAVLASQHGTPDVASLTFILQEDRADLPVI